MPVLKIANQKNTKNTTAALSSDVSSSISGNMDLIQYQIGQKSNDYINIKNAVKILEQYSNWNGYIKIYTEIENNFNTGDTIYITYTDPDIFDPNIVFNLENPSNFDNPFDDYSKSEFYIGYKVLYTNKYKNEIVINRYYNDIGDGKLLKNQYLSKISCRGGNFYNDIADGVVFYDCNIFNGEFSTIIGYVSGITNSGIKTISGATIICVGLTSTSDLNSHYSLNVPSGINIVKCYATNYITNTFYIDIATNETKYYNISMLSGTNSITIAANTNTITTGQLINFSSITVGYDEPVNYQWKINGINVGTNNSIFSYNLFVNGDIVTCEVSDDFGKSSSNEVTITVVVTTTTTTLFVSGTTTTTSTTAPITFSFNIKYGNLPPDVCNGASTTIYSLVSSPNIGDILYKDSICSQPWDTTNGTCVFFINPAVFGTEIVVVNITPLFPYSIGEIRSLSGEHCLPITTTTTTPGPIVLGFDINGHINFENLGTNIVSIGLSGMCIASQSWINCAPPIGYANFNYQIDSNNISAAVTESSATSIIRDTISFDIDSYLFTGVTSNSIILRTIDFNASSDSCGDGWGNVSLYIKSLTIISGPGNVVLGTTTYTPAIPPTPSVNFDITSNCTYPNAEIAIEAFTGGSGLYQISENICTSELDAINGTFIDETYSYIYPGLSDGTYYVAVRDKNNISNITVKHITIYCNPITTTTTTPAPTTTTTLPPVTTTTTLPPVTTTTTTLPPVTTTTTTLPPVTTTTTTAIVVNATILASSPTGIFQYGHSTIVVNDEIFIGERLLNPQVVKFNPNDLTSYTAQTMTGTGTYGTGLETVCYSSITGKLYFSSTNTNNNNLDIVEVSTNNLTHTIHNIAGLSSSDGIITTDGTYIYGANSIEYFKIRISDWSIIATNPLYAAHRPHSIAINVNRNEMYICAGYYSPYYFTRVRLTDLVVLGNGTGTDISSYVSHPTDDLTYYDDGVNCKVYIGGEQPIGYNGAIITVVSGGTDTVSGITINPTYGLSNDGIKIYNCGYDTATIQSFNMSNPNLVSTYNIAGYIPNEIIILSTGRKFVTNWGNLSSAKISEFTLP